DAPDCPFGLSISSQVGPSADVVDALDFQMAERVRLISKRYAVSVATIFHAAWSLVLAQAAGKDDVVFGTVVLGRMQGDAGAQRILGVFINTLPFRIRLASVSVADLVHRTQKELADLLNYEHASLAAAQRCTS